MAKRKESREEKEKELQRKYIQLQILKKQLSALLEEKIALDQKVSEILETKNSIQKIGKTKEGEDSWSSIGSGAYIQTTMKDTKKIAINLGADIFAKKSISEADEILQKRMSELVDLDNRITKDMNTLISQVERLQEEVQRAAQETGIEIQ